MISIQFVIKLVAKTKSVYITIYNIIFAFWLRLNIIQEFTNTILPINAISTLLDAYRVIFT